MQTGRRAVVSGGGGAGGGEHMLNGFRAATLQGKKHSGTWLCNHVNALNTAEPYKGEDGYGQHGQDDIFHVRCILPQLNIFKCKTGERIKIESSGRSEAKSTERGD